MQEEAENRTVNLMISTSKLTRRTLVAAFRKYAQHRARVKAGRAAEGDHGMYAKDISKKISSVKHDKQRKGLFIGGKPVYG